MAENRKNTKNDDGAGTSQDAGNPTEDADEGENTSPDGQTNTRDVTSDGDAEFAPQERFHPVNRTATGRNEEEEESTPKVATQLAKALGRKGSDVLSYNDRTRTIVLNNGGKYQLSKNSKSLRHLAGPTPPADLKLQVIDARTRSSLTGAAAVLNSQANDPSQRG